MEDRYHGKKRRKYLSPQGWTLGVSVYQWPQYKWQGYVGICAGTRLSEGKTKTKEKVIANALNSSTLSDFSLQWRWWYRSPTPLKAYRRLNSQRSVFPSDTALLKALYLSTFEATKKWTMPIRNWGRVYGELAIMYDGQFAGLIPEISQIHQG